LHAKGTNPRRSPAVVHQITKRPRPPRHKRQALAEALASALGDDEYTNSPDAPSLIDVSPAALHTRTEAIPIRAYRAGTLWSCAAGDVCCCFAPGGESLCAVFGDVRTCIAFLYVYCLFQEECG
jgi:hypothetical protein